MYSVTTVDNPHEYQPLSIRSDASFTQEWFYGTWQEKMGRKVFRFVILKDAHAVGFFQAVCYPLLFGRYYFYIPHGPVVSEAINGELSQALEATLRELSKRENVVFVRMDPYPKQEPQSFRRASTASYYGAYFQSPFDWVLDISKDEKSLLGEMHSKTRYSINLSLRGGVSYEMIQGAAMTGHFEEFYTMMRETALRGKFALHPKEYYKIIFKDAKNNPNIVLWNALFEGKVLATHLLIYHGDVAFYPFGASIREHSNLCPTYGLHWSAILEGKKRGCHFYNFGAIEDPSLPHENWQGISVYKRKFGGSVLEYSSFYDLVIEPFWYHLYVLRKKIRALR